MATPAYVTLAEVKRHIGLTSSVADQDTKLNDMIGWASDHIDTVTRKFWEKRTLTVTTEAVFRNQKKLFMPAPIISITSIKEAGVALDVSEFKIYKDWLEKTNSSFAEVTGRFEIGGPVWSRLQQDIVVVGDFGHTVTPRDIRLLTAEIVGIFAGMKTRSFTQDDGVGTPRVPSPVGVAELQNCLLGLAVLTYRHHTLYLAVSNITRSHHD